MSEVNAPPLLIRYRAMMLVGSMPAFLVQEAEIFPAAFTGGPLDRAVSMAVPTEVIDTHLTLLESRRCTSVYIRSLRRHTMRCPMRARELEPSCVALARRMRK